MMRAPFAACVAMLFAFPFATLPVDEPGVLPSSSPGLPRVEVPALRWVVTAGWDHGFEKLVTVEFSDGSREDIRANGGLVLTAGAGFLPLLAGRLETLASLGFKYDAITGANGSIHYTALQLEVLEAWVAPPFRLGLGASLSFLPGVGGTCAASSVSLRLRDSAGLLARLEYSHPFGGGRGSWLLGARFLLQRMALETGGPAVDTNAVGLFVGLAY